MNYSRFISLAIALASASVLIACSTAPAMPMGVAPGSSMAPRENMAKMNAQMSSMREMHDRMMNAKTPEERSKLMAEHMEMMQVMMTMMKDRMPPAAAQQ